MKRVVVDSSAIGGLTFAETKRPDPLPHQNLIKVTAYSLNRGEIGMAQNGQKGASIGWDYVGTVEHSAQDGSGLKEGTRVVGWRPEMDAFAEYVVGDPKFLAGLPDNVSDTEAATLPVAGLTALTALDKGTRLIGNKALITGVTGGVGFFALQLAKIAGAKAVAQVRRQEQANFAREIGADAVVVTNDGAELAAEGPFQLVIDGVGGPMFNTLVQITSKGGTLVSYGLTSGEESILSTYPALFGNGGQRTIYGLTLYTEVELEPSSIGLERLLNLVSQERLKLPNVVEGDWSETQEFAQKLLDRQFEGKAVLTLS